MCVRKLCTNLYSYLYSGDIAIATAIRNMDWFPFSNTFYILMQMFERVEWNAQRLYNFTWILWNVLNSTNLHAIKLDLKFYNNIQLCYLFSFCARVTLPFHGTKQFIHSKPQLTPTAKYSTKIFRSPYILYNIYTVRILIRTTKNLFPISFLSASNKTIKYGRIYG